MTLEEMNGYRVIVTTDIKKKVQARTHKKRRINKKWLKKYGYKEVPDNNLCYFMGDCVFMTPKGYEKLKKACGDKINNPEEVDSLNIKTHDGCKVRYCKKRGAKS